MIGMAPKAGSTCVYKPPVYFFAMQFGRNDHRKQAVVNEKRPLNSIATGLLAAWPSFNL
jgi:hypothetical protein